ncbi:MAG: ArsR family transcriptional regulator [archaeon]
MNFDKLAFVIGAPNRIEVVLALDSEKIPKQLVKEIGKQDANISRALRELTKREVVKCLTPNNKRGRIYTLTPDGLQIRQKLLSNAKKD